MEIKLIETTRVKPYPNNPRVNDNAVKGVAESIKQFGFKQPIVVDGELVVIAGHTRLKAAQRLKLKEIPCVIATELTAEQINAYRILDNKLNEKAEWDIDALKIELDNLSDFSFVPFDVDFSDLIKEEPSTEDDEFNIDAELESEEEPVTKLGDVWICGNHRVLCGDSTSEESYSTLMVGKLADILITDPPYNVNYEGKTKKALKIKNDEFASGSDFLDFLIKFYTCSVGVLKSGGAFYIWHADLEGLNFRKAANEAGLTVRQCLIWCKNTIVMGRQDYHWQHEPCLYGWKDGASHEWFSDRKQSTIIRFNKPSRNSEHPTMKPLELFMYLITNSCRQGGIALDPFLGSGTTLIAAERLKRKCFGIELDPKYCDVICKRFYKETGIIPTRERDGLKFPVEHA